MKKIVRARDPVEAKALGLQVLTKKSGDITAINLSYKPCGINILHFVKKVAAIFTVTISRRRIT